MAYKRVVCEGEFFSRKNGISSSLLSPRVMFSVINLYLFNNRNWSDAVWFGAGNR